MKYNTKDDRNSGPQYDTIDRLELVKHINDTDIYSALDFLDRASENEDGWVVLNLGEDNSTTFH